MSPPLHIARERPMLSLVVPTRERAQTLAFTLATALEQDSDDYEVIVSDNASADDTKATVARIADPRLRYFNTGERLSMCGNYEFALKQARGDYVIIIGDDDAVIPGALDHLLSLLRDAAAPVIHMWPLHTYDWPANGKPANVAYLAPARAKQEVDLKAKARRIVSLGGWKYYELPSPYHAAIPRSILEALRERTGRVFHSTQPDVFTAMAIPAFADTAVNVGVSITFNGRSARSNGLGFVNKAARSNIDRFLQEYGSYRFHPSLFPDAPSAANMIPDAILLACELFPDLYDISAFRYEAMWAYVCRLRFVGHTEVLRSVRRIRRFHSFRVWSFIWYVAIHESAVLRRRILNLVMPLGSFRRSVPDNIQEFARALAGEPRAGSVA